MTETTTSATRVTWSLDTKWWWDALEGGELLVPSCGSCGNRFFPPQAFCPHCGSEDWHGATTDGTGKVYSWVVIHHPFSPEFRDAVPYAIVAIDLDDGGRLIGRYIGDPTTLRDALPVRVKLWQQSGQTLLGFQPRG